MDLLPEAIAAALAVIAYIEVRVTSQVNRALNELESARQTRRDSTHETEGRV